MTLKLVPFPGPDINDIPARLRDLADLLESGVQEGTLDGLQDTRVFIWINVTTEGHLESGAMGRCHDRMHAVGIMQAAAAKLLAQS